MITYSGYHCPSRDKNTHSASDLQHTNDKATDIAVNGINPLETAKIAKSNYYDDDSKGYRNFIHMGNMKSKKRGENW